MSKAKQKSKQSQEPDGVYVLKLVFYMILGSLWLKVTSENGSFQAPLPIGLIVGMVFAAHEHFRIDRKVEYCVLLMSALIGFWAPFGIYFLV